MLFFVFQDFFEHKSSRNVPFFLSQLDDLLIQQDGFHLNEIKDNQIFISSSHFQNGPRGREKFFKSATYREICTAETMATEPPITPKMTANSLLRRFLTKAKPAAVFGQAEILTMVQPWLTWWGWHYFLKRGSIKKQMASPIFSPVFLNLLPGVFL